MDETQEMILGELMKREFIGMYDEAVKSPYIRKPISYTLYRMWRKYNANEEEREVDE